jgi:hypothetical protein
LVFALPVFSLHPEKERQKSGTGFRSQFFRRKVNVKVRPFEDIAVSRFFIVEFGRSNDLTIPVVSGKFKIELNKQKPDIPRNSDQKNVLRDANRVCVEYFSNPTPEISWIAKCRFWPSVSVRKIVRQKRSAYCNSHFRLNE